VRSGIVRPASFSLAPNGTFTVSPPATAVLSLDVFSGLRRLNGSAPL
jgi:hypothetical protein